MIEPLFSANGAVWNVLWYLHHYQTDQSGFGRNLSAIHYKITHKYPQTQRWRGQAGGWSFWCSFRLNFYNTGIFSADEVPGEWV